MPLGGFYVFKVAMHLKVLNTLSKNSDSPDLGKAEVYTKIVYYYFIQATIPSSML